MLVTLLGIVILVRLEQFLNAESPMLVTLLGITYSVLVLSFTPVIVHDVGVNVYSKADKASSSFQNAVKVLLFETVNV